ncbi:MAG: methionyl-tRNA formyltransferase [Pseudobutyrivibrio sp.]|nr:methionyl-tRNA formyltransferase [Pseudobutyrivibrio sp.]
MTDKSELTFERIKEINPKYIFFPHWSWIIPKDIYENFECIVFHMTDLPFGRGGSPLQNLIVRGIYDTKISAIKVEKGLDTGPIYAKVPIDISEGSAEEIFKRVSDMVFEYLIPKIVEQEPIPKEQTGEPVVFSRRRPEESELPEGLTDRQTYDYIRMLDGEGYPKAFKRTDKGRLVYSNARYIDGKLLYDEEFIEEI